MNEFKLAIQLSDEALASALARAIAKDYPYIRVSIGETEDADFTIRDAFLGKPAPVREIVDRAFAASGKEFFYPQKPSSCLFTAFTSGGGGRGVTSCSRLYAQARAGDGRKVLHVSFDPYAMPTDETAGMELLHKVLGGSRLPLKAGCIAAEEGFYVPAQSSWHNLFAQLSAEEAAAFLEDAEDSGEWEEVVLDVPRASSSWKELMGMCERQIVLCGEGIWQMADDAAYEELRYRKETIADGDAPPDLLRIAARPTGMEWSSEDLFSEWGCEVRRLAQTLAAN